MIELQTLAEQSPVRDDEARQPRGPRMPRRRPSNFGVGVLFAGTGLMLLGAFFAFGAAPASAATLNHASPSFATSIHCHGPMTIVAPSSAQVGQRVTIHVVVSLAPRAASACGLGSIYTYAGLPPGISTSHTSTVTGVVTHVGTYHALVIVTGPSGSLSRAFTIQVNPG